MYAQEQGKERKITPPIGQEINVLLELKIQEQHGRVFWYSRGKCVIMKKSCPWEKWQVTGCLGWRKFTGLVWVVEVNNLKETLFFLKEYVFTALILKKSKHWEQKDKELYNSFYKGFTSLYVWTWVYRPISTMNIDRNLCVINGVLKIYYQTCWNFNWKINKHKNVFTSG